MLNLNHKAKRDLLTKMSYIRNTDGGLVVQRNYTYDKIGRPLTRQTLRSGGAMNETFDYNDRSELIHATRTVGDSFDYAYDNIGNRVTAQEVNSGATSDIAYVTNDLNQYTQIDTNGSDFTPEYDADGNQTLIQTETGIWRVTYNVQNRAVRFENESSGTVITCDYDYMGRRVFKKVEKDGVVTSHEHYLYRGYLQIASLDMMEGQNQALINAYVWDPTQPVATRPLVIIYKGVAYYYGWDLTKNITEIFSLSARLQIDYVYTPFGQVRENGIIPQPIQWSSEVYDAELELVYYNYRYYNPRDGRWTRRDPGMEYFSINLYAFALNNTMTYHDVLGFWKDGSYGDENAAYKDRGHSDFPGQGMFDYTKEDNDPSTSPFNPASTWQHFRDLPEVEDELLDAVKECDKGKYESRAHQMQDYFSHYKQGFESSPLLPLYIIISFIPGLVSWGLSGHARETIVQRITHQGKKPDNPEDYREDYEAAKERTQAWLDLWLKCCKQVGGQWKRDNCTDCSHIDIP